MIWWSLVYFPQGFLTFKKYSHFKFLNMAWSSPYMREKTKTEVECIQLQLTGEVVVPQMNLRLLEYCYNLKISWFVFCGVSHPENRTFPVQCNTLWYRTSPQALCLSWASYDLLHVDLSINVNSYFCPFSELIQYPRVRTH